MTLKERQEKNRLLQSALAEAQKHIDTAKLLADELQTSFEFLGRTYAPLKTTTTGGRFDHEPSTDNWDSSDDSWQASGIGC